MDTQGSVDQGLDRQGHLVEAYAALRAGDLAVAAEAFRTALARDGAELDAQFGLGMALSAAGAGWAAVGCFRAALRLKIDHLPSYLGLAQAYQSLRRFDDAVETYEQARSLGFDNLEVDTQLAFALTRDGLHREAFTVFRRALRRAPDDALLISQLGVCLLCLGRSAWGLALARRAVAQAPEWFGSHGNLGLVYFRLHRLDEADACFDRARALAPDSVAVRYNQSLVHLMRGDYRRGFRLFGDHGRVPLPAGGVRRWRGEPFGGKTLVVVARNGLGDTLQFVRYLPRIKARGGRVVLVVQDALRALLQGVAGADLVLGRSQSPPAHELEASLMEMPATFEDTLDSIPVHSPYLQADPERKTYWRRRLAIDDLLRVGLAWHGNAAQRDGLYRSCSLSDLAPLARVEGVRFFSLQKGAGSEELRAPPPGLVLHAFDEDFDRHPGAFLDTAAVLESLDLVISIDTSIAHLAGALARPVWLVLPDWVDWRWMLERTDSPWYPSMRLFRQPRPFDWATPFAEVRTALAALVASRRHL